MSLVIEIVKELAKAWQTGGRAIKSAIILAITLLGIGLFAYGVADVLGDRLTRLVGLAATISGGAIGLAILGLQRGKEEVKQEAKIREVERRAQENPRETQAAWDLARVKLESYLDRNLSQVRSIFWLTVLVMTGGFALIGVGAFQAFRDPGNFRASVLTAVSGVVVSFIGGTFLVLYKSTMTQAKDYVDILERINAVGMSVQILDSLDEGNKDLKHQTIADVARHLLSMYSLQGQKAAQASKISRTVAR